MCHACVISRKYLECKLLSFEETNAHFRIDTLFTRKANYFQYSITSLSFLSFISAQPHKLLCFLLVLFSDYCRRIKRSSEKSNGRCHFVLEAKVEIEIIFLDIYSVLQY